MAGCRLTIRVWTPPSSRPIRSLDFASAECGCIRVSVLLMGERCCPGHHESRRRGANHWSDLEGQNCYRLVRAGGRSAVHEGMREPR
jgi:hypothetical protein